MLALKQICPPGQFKPEGIGEPVIGVRILIPLDTAAPYFFPEQNRAGAEILCRLLQARMEMAGVCVARVSRGLALNRAYYLFTVSELFLALEAVKEELEEIGLLEWAQVAWHDPREDVWRISHSKSARFEAPSDEELATERQFLDALVRAAEKVQQA